MNRSLYERLDRSPRAADLIKRLSARLSRQRGLPIMIAVFLTLLSLIVHLVMALIPNNTLLMICGFSLLHVAIIVGLFGIMLAEPLGRG